MLAKIGCAKNGAMLFIAAVLLVCGCVTKVPPANGGSYGPLSMYDIESATKSLMSKMLGHPRFKKEYEIAKSDKGGKLPVISIGEIRSRVGERVQGHVNLAGNMILDALYDSDLFNLDSEAMELDPDFTVRGSIRQPVGESDYYMDLELHAKSGSASNGTLWRDTQKLVKCRND